MYKVSFVVDNNPVMYYQAELLLFSLETFGKVNKCDILVHCTTKVAANFLFFLKENNYDYKIIEPFLDGKYCNKIRQLESFFDTDRIKGVFLLDTDIFVLATLLPIDEESFSAKIVDDSNPPLEVIQRIFNTANLSHPSLVNTDWGNNETFATNFNGGYYYIPRKYIRMISDSWRKWGDWLFSRPELFNTMGQAIHTDQVAMAMALCDSHIQYKNVPSNYNCPSHINKNQSYLSQDIPIQLIHYHNEINVFGLLNNNSENNELLKKAIQKTNNAISQRGNFFFYEGFRKALIKPLVITEKTKKLDKALALLMSNYKTKIRLILHAGTPKTGTTSLQFFLDQNQKELEKAGCLYPPVYLNTNPPKHQWIVNALLETNEKILIENIRSIILQIKENTHTIILSTEGIYNHWRDFSQEAKSFIKIMSEWFDLYVWIWFRETSSYLNSLYKQNLKNPKVVIPVYGQDMSFLHMLQDDWFSSQLDYLGFVYEIESIISRKNCNIFQYSNDIIEIVNKVLDLDIGHQFYEKENIGLSDNTIELLRIINRLPLTSEEKNTCVNYLHKIDKVIAKYSRNNLIDEESNFIINELSALQKTVLQSKYNISF